MPYEMPFMQSTKEHRRNIQECGSPSDGQHTKTSQGMNKQIRKQRRLHMEIPILQTYPIYPKYCNTPFCTTLHPLPKPKEQHEAAEWQRSKHQHSLLKATADTSSKAYQKLTKDFH